MAGASSTDIRTARLAPWLPRLQYDTWEVRITGTVIAVVLAVVLLGVGLFYVWHRMQLVQIGYEISSLEEKNKELKKRKRELIVEISSLQSPAELEKKALQNGLFVTPRDKVVHVP